VTMKVIILKFALILISIFKRKNSFSLLDIIYPITLILITIIPIKISVATIFIIIKFALILISILKIKSSFSLHITIYPIPLILIPIIPNIFSLSMKLSFAILFSRVHLKNYLILFSKIYFMN
jgi:hypothetical protein